MPLLNISRRRSICWGFEISDSAVALTHVHTATPLPNLSEPQVIDLSGGELNDMSAAGVKVERCRRLSKFDPTGLRG